MLDDLCAPAVVALHDTLLVLGSSQAPNFALWMSTNPLANQWTKAVENFPVAAWNPDLFLDTEGKLYLY